MKPKWFKYIIRDGEYKKVECTHHSYAWSGQMPCTGIYRCVYCGKPEDENSFTGKKNDGRW